jgi:mRNA interferase MazF
VVKRGEIWLAILDPTIGSEIQKTRPCLIVSPEEMNEHLRTCIVAPMTTAAGPAPYRIPITFQGRRGLISLDQMRAVDKRRLVKSLGIVSAPLGAALQTLQEMFAL